MIQEYYLRAVLNGTLSSSKEKDFVLECHELVLSFLELKWRQGFIYGGQKNTQLRDLAWDCLALAFETNDLSPMQKFRNALLSVLENHENPSYEELLIATRRVLFQTVNDELYNQYRDHDGVSTKLIRGIKTAAKIDPEISITSRGNKKYVCFVGKDTSPSIEEVSPDLLKIRLNARASSETNTSVLYLMQLTKEIVSRNHEKTVAVSLYSLASCFREFYALRSLAIEDNHPQESLLLDEELSYFIEMSLTELKNEIGTKYVTSGKLLDDDWKLYSTVIKHILMDQYGSEGPSKKSYFKYIESHKPEISRESYQLMYRSQLEYLLRLCKERMIQLIKKEITQKN